MCVPYDTNKIRVNAKMGGFNLQAFQLPHGETTSYGALIRHGKETFLFLTDFEYSSYVFKACKVNHFLIECNYQKEYVDLDAPNLAHKLKGHASLDTCKAFIKTNITSEMQNVILCHLGRSSTNAKECVNAIKDIVSENVKVDYARANTVYELGV